MGYFHKKNVFLDGLIYFLAASVITIALALLLSLFGTIFGTQYTDFSCDHSLRDMECELVRHTNFLQPTEVRIQNPLAVAVINPCARKDIFGKYSYDYECYGNIYAEIRSKNVSYGIKIYGGSDSHKVNAIAREINEFLSSSSTPSFHKRF
jgi:hypothetical protein